MAIINCHECGRVCVSNPSGQCAACYQRTRQAEVKVAEYLEDNQNSTLEEIHQATGVERHIILQMIRNGHITEGSVSYPCENCRQPIVKGRLCARCAEQVMTLLEPLETRPLTHERRQGEMYSRQLILGRLACSRQSIS